MRSIQMSGEMPGTQPLPIWSPQNAPDPAPEVLRSILDSMLARIAYLDRRRRFRFVNAAYATAIGVAPQAILGRSVAAVRGRAHARRTAHIARTALEGHTTRWQG